MRSVAGAVMAWSIVDWTTRSRGSLTLQQASLLLALAFLHSLQQQRTAGLHVRRVAAPSRANTASS